MGSTCRTCVLIVTIHLISSMTAQEMDKRGPQGFLGMRGKKEDNELFKRKPQFFVGVKGKKTLYDMMSGSDYYKRAPMGFMGMRGKKNMEDYTPNLRNSLIGQIDYTSNENDINEFPYLNEIMSRYLQKISARPIPQIVVDDMTRAIVKRGNMNQFFGVRGKKPMQKRLTDVSFRGKFIGVRGKKDVGNSGPQEIKFLLDNGPFPKRKGQMGFIGMRGKKWENPDLDDETLADVPPSDDETLAGGPSSDSSPEMEATTDFFDSLLN